MSNGKPQTIILAVVGLLVGYGVATAQHFFAKEALNRKIDEAQSDIKNLKGGREAIEKRANRLEAQVYTARAQESLASGDTRMARQFLSNASTFFENGALKGNADHVKVLEKIGATRKSMTAADMKSLREEMARLTPPLAAIAGGAGQ